MREVILLAIVLLAVRTGSSQAASHHITVENFRFDADDNNSTQVDTLSISVNDTVQWDWVEGFHTVTSGLSSNPRDNPGELFNAPSDAGNTTFRFVFMDEGDVAYFCIPHEGLNMKGVIRVLGGADIDDNSESGAKLPAAISLSQNYPNPFNPVTTITFQIAAADGSAGEVQETFGVTLDVYDMRGRKVRTLISDVLPAGQRSVVWDGRSNRGDVLGSGVYLYRLTVDDRTVSRKMVLAQ
jgi:plastocyanin